MPIVKVDLPMFARAIKIRSLKHAAFAVLQIVQHNKVDAQAVTSQFILHC